MKKVLIVEDSPFIAEAVKILLNAHGIYLDYLRDSTKAVDLINKGGYSLIILDLMMPVVSGKDILLKLKSDERTKNIPVIILTAKTDSLKWEPDLKVCDKFITKPFDNTELVSSVMGFLNKEKIKAV